MDTSAVLWDIAVLCCPSHTLQQELRSVKTMWKKAVFAIACDRWFINAFLRTKQPRYLTEQAVKNSRASWKNFKVLLKIKIWKPAKSQQLSGGARHLVSGVGKSSRLPYAVCINTSWHLWIRGWCWCPLGWKNRVRLPASKWVEGRDDL